jgi:hypothetical protein
MANQDYVPRTHAGFNSWQNTINNMVIASAATWGVPPAMVTELNENSTQFGVLYKPIENKATRSLQDVAAFN